ncbi:MAG: hypothetical protein C0404_05220, partial [Verrucomicrobia bacterium]|nr:hypothetical protein [Verrucomicrobiota bacterium]
QGADGSWDGGGTKPAMTSFALLCYLAHGETPASEEFGPTVEKAIKFLVENQTADGRFNGLDGNQYGLPIAAYALSEAYGMTKVPTIQMAAEKSIDIIIKGQHASGGWNYKCGPEDRDDTSYMAWCAQALKAAHMAGLQNKGLKEAMKHAIDGFKKNHDNNKVGEYGAAGFGYTSPGSTGLTGAGVLCMQLMGAAKEKETRSGLQWLEQVTFDWQNPWGARPIYYWYYITQAKFHGGGDTWNNWNKVFSPQLVKNQIVQKGAGIDGKDIGYWENAKDGHGLVYSTTLCCLMLEVYYRYLPTFQTPKDDAAAAAPAAGPAKDDKKNDIKIDIQM